MLVTCQAGNDLPHRQFVIVFQLTPESIRQHFFGELASQVVHSFFHDDCLEASRSREFCSVWKLSGCVDLTASMTPFETSKPVIVF